MVTILNEINSKKLLESVGISIPKGYFVSIDDLTDGIYRAAVFIGNTRYVIKVVSPNISHKSDVGGIILNVEHDDIFEAVIQIIKNVSEHHSNAKIDGIYIEEMVSPGVETIIGIKTDPQFGKVIMFGMGGIYTEVFKDISMRILPITKDDIREMITETKIYKILSGARGKVYDIEAINDTLIKVSLLADSKNIQELDINPLAVHENGVKALDARIMLL